MKNARSSAPAYQPSSKFLPSATKLAVSHSPKMITIPAPSKPVALPNGDFAAKMAAGKAAKASG